MVQILQIMMDLHPKITNYLKLSYLCSSLNREFFFILLKIILIIVFLVLLTNSIPIFICLRFIHHQLIIKFDLISFINHLLLILPCCIHFLMSLILFSIAQQYLKVIFLFNFSNKSLIQKILLFTFLTVMQILQNFFCIFKILPQLFLLSFSFQFQILQVFSFSPFQITTLKFLFHY